MIAMGRAVPHGHRLSSPASRLGTIAVVAQSRVAGARSLCCPQLLSWLGPRADWGKIPFLGRKVAPPGAAPFEAVGRTGTAA